MLSKNDIMVDKDAFEEVIQNDLKDMKETDVKARHCLKGGVVGCVWCHLLVCGCVYNNVIDDL